MIWRHSRKVFDQVRRGKMWTLLKSRLIVVVSGDVCPSVCPHVDNRSVAGDRPLGDRVRRLHQELLRGARRDLQHDSRPDDRTPQETRNQRQFRFSSVVRNTNSEDMLCIWQSYAVVLTLARTGGSRAMDRAVSYVCYLCACFWSVI